MPRAVIFDLDGTLVDSLQDFADAMNHVLAANGSERRGRRPAATGKVRQVLQAIASGQYGDCRLCDELIGIRRLQARPESPLGVECQGKQERRR